MTWVNRARRAAAAALTLPLVLALTGCASPSAPSTPVTFTISDVRVGTGAAVERGDFLQVNYTGWLYDGTKPDNKGQQFDASAPGFPLTFWLGTGQVIPGWEQGVPGMRVGGLRRLIVPASLAYGRAGAGTSIPPNASLVFDIELVSVF
jgi:FKBP-type peptidyl-prolyl cis-trans isomerase FkpA